MAGRSEDEGPDPTSFLLEERIEVSRAHGLIRASQRSSHGNEWWSRLVFGACLVVVGSQGMTYVTMLARGWHKVRASRDEHGETVQEWMHWRPSIAEF
ncbi:MAG: hypothetical protein JWO69_1308 [Thermoleophilia bacterium]|nr:hypothetical protein [Thermoleophilia bacterium]